MEATVSSLTASVTARGNPITVPDLVAPLLMRCPHHGCSLIEAASLSPKIRGSRSKPLKECGQAVRQGLGKRVAIEGAEPWTKVREELSAGPSVPGFKRSSQHLERGGCDGCSEAAFGSVRARRLALAWSALCCAA